MSLQIVKGTTGYVSIAPASVATGWQISDGYAVHVACNSGFIIALTEFGLIVGHTYVFSYTLDNYLSGGLQLYAGTLAGTNRTSNGTWTDILVQTGNDSLSFFSDGGLRVSHLVFYDLAIGPQSAQVVSFFDKNNKWTADYEYENDTMAKFIDSLVSWKDGALWLHNSNPIQNNLYGVQYSSKLTIIVNAEYQHEKIFYNFRLDAVGKWYMPTISTSPSNQFPDGMLTQLKKNNFKQIDNKLWSDILGDVTDPNFATISDPVQRRLYALFGGRKMQGGWLIVDMQCDDTAYHEVSSVETYFTDVYRDI